MKNEKSGISQPPTWRMRNLDFFEKGLYKNKAYQMKITDKKHVFISRFCTLKFGH